MTDATLSTREIAEIREHHLMRDAIIKARAALEARDE